MQIITVKANQKDIQAIARKRKVIGNKKSIAKIRHYFDLIKHRKAWVHHYTIEKDKCEIKGNSRLVVVFKVITFEEV